MPLGTSKRSDYSALNMTGIYLLWCNEMSGGRECTVAIVAPCDSQFFSPLDLVNDIK